MKNKLLCAPNPLVYQYLLNTPYSEEYIDKYLYRVRLWLPYLLLTL